MKTIVVSDLHLAPRFIQPKFEFLSHLFSTVDRVIINGDFWEGSMFTFDDFVNSPWSELFPVLKSRQTVYLYGNHDPASLVDDRVNSFSDEQAEFYQFDWQVPVYLEHGHRLIQGLERLNFLSNKMILRKIGHSISGSIEDLGIRLFGPSFSRVFVRRDLENKVIKNRLSKKTAKDAVYITGHTHRPAQAAGKVQYYNTGCILYGFADYLVITDQEIILKRERYR